MKKLLFLLAILLASLPLRAAEEEIYLNFTPPYTTAGLFNKTEDSEASKDYNAKVYGKFAPGLNGTFVTQAFPGASNSSLIQGCGVVGYFEFFKGSNSIYKISFNPQISHSAAAGAYSCRTASNAKRLVIYSSTINPEIVVTSSNTAEYPIKRVVFGDAYNYTTATALTEDQLNAIEVTNSVDGTWSFSDGSLIFTPTTPQSEIKFKVVGDNVKTTYTTDFRIGHLGVVRAVKSAAPKLKADGATTFPMMVGDELQFIGASGDVEIAAEDGVTYVYTDNGGEPSASSSQVQNGVIKLSGMQIGETKTLKIAVLEEGGELGNVREVVCRRVAVPTVTLPENTPGYADGVFSYQVAQGKITIARPAGVDKVFFTLDGYEPNTPQAHELPADGIITLPTAAVGHTTQLKLVAQCGTEYGAVTTIPCKRVPMSKPEIIGYTIDFTTRDQGFDTYLDGYDESTLITDFANGIVIDENHLMLRLKSSFSYDSESDGPFLEAQISDSPVADANGKWITILVPMTDHPECVVFEERGDVYTSINFGMEGNYFLTDSRKQSYLHLRASSLAKSLITGAYPAGKDHVTSEAVTLHVMKAKPAAPAKPVVTMWTEQTVYTPDIYGKTVTIENLQPLTDGQTLDISGDRLLLAFASHYDANNEPKIQYQLSGSPEADPDGIWTQRLTPVKPASGTYNGNDLMLLQKEDNINIKDLLFPATDGKRPTEIYLHLRAVTTNDSEAYEFVASETATLHLTHTRPAAPAIKLLTPGSTKGTLTRFVNSAKARPETAGIAENQKLQYAFAEATGSIWPGTEPEAWTDYDDNSASVIEKDGRMYARIYDSEYDQASDIAVMDFELIKADRIKAEGWQGVENNSLVQLDEPMKVMGCYLTSSTAAGSSRTAYVYLVDSDGNPLKMVVSGDESALKQTLTALGYFDFANGGQHQGEDLVVDAGSIIARVSKTVTDDNLGLMPEILVTPTAGESYLDYLGSASWKAFDKSDAYMTSQESMVKDGSEWTEQPRTSIEVKSDFGRMVSLRSLEWLGANNRVRTADGVELTLYNRLDVSETGYDFAADVQHLVAGRLYKVTGYVGQLNGELALFPISATMQCPGTPTLYAPNLIDGEADQQGFIAVNAISEEVAFSAASDTEEPVKFFYKSAPTADGLKTAELKEAADGTFSLTLDEETTQYMAVYGQLNDMLSLRPAMVAITRHKAETVNSIAEFKTLEAERRAEADYDGVEKLYRLNGKAVIRMTTPYYLYVSDIADDNTPAEPAKQYLLIYNENGWTNPQITDGDATRSLQAGDVIENFALVGRDGMKLRGNIISNSTGFARTYKYAGEKVDPADFSPSAVEVNYVDASSDSHYSKVALGEDQRMTYIELRNVKVKRSGSDESDYSYTLDIAGEPSLTFDVFPRTQGWHTMWKDGEGFTITGVVVRDDAADGTEGYAFAPTAFKAANSLDGQLGIRFEGNGHTDDNGVQYFVEGKAVIEYIPAEGQTASTSIYYTLDGSDPRDNVAGRIHAEGTKAEITLSEDIVVRAFAAAPGLNPTAEKSMTLKNSVSEVQYILNFLRAGREGMTYRFTSKLQIVASGGDYLFVAGPVGHFLPVYNSNGWDETEYPAGSYVEHLLAVKSTDSNGNVIADASHYTTPEAIDPSEIGSSEQITVEPDEVTALTTASARRLVTISNVTANAMTARAAGAPFTITTVDGSQSHPLMDGNLGEVVIKEADASGNIVDTQLGFADGEAYNITGFVMLGEGADGSDEGAVELWPVSAIHLVRTPAVSVSVQNDLTLSKTDENEYLARLTGVAAVSISAGNVRNARIYYSFDNEEWFEYFRPIAVESSCMIHAKAVAPGMAESVHTHLTLEKVTISGDIEFAATPAPEGGKVSVALSPADKNMAEGSYKIHYTTDGTNPTTSSAIYTAPFELTESGTVKAILVENGCEPGSVCTAYIGVADPTTTDTPDPTVSGRVKFTLDDSDPAKVLVKIEPEGNAAPDYKIYYTTEAGKTLPEDGIEYTAPFEVTESSIVMAVLVENGKSGGPVAEVSVWVNPGVTGIDGIPTDEAEGGVRVDGNSIAAPEGSRIFDISGRQTGSNDLRRGVYIVVTPDGKSTKVLVK